jgi:predicted DNA repair protein MutK
MTGIAILMTIGVYGAVAAIVKLDDLGLYLNKRQGTLPRLLGAAILKAAPYLMKALSIAGTVAMFLVGGGILTHGIPGLPRSIEAMVNGRASWLVTLVPPLLNALVGLIAGALVLAVVSLGTRMVRKTP